MADDLYRNLLVVFSMASDNDNWRDVVGNDVIDGYTIDTQWTLDYGYETGVKLDEGSWVIVERYADKESAKAGHDKWVSVCKDAHPAKLWSVQFDELEDLF